MNAPVLIRRAMLYVPASSSKMLEKSRNLNVDCVVYDLEDSVAVSKKTEARTSLCKFLQTDRPPNVKEVAVRINSVDSGYALKDMIEVLQAPTVDTLVIPKVQSAFDLQFVTKVIQEVLPSRHSLQDSRENQKPPIRLLPLIESAKGLTNLTEICQSTPYISGLVFAAEDFALDMDITRSPSLTELLYTRSAIVAAAKAHGLPSVIDLVCTEFKGELGEKKLKEECVGGKKLGFTGKQLIHPGQIKIAQEVYGPDKEQVEWAVRVTIGDTKAESAGKGAWSLDGKMIDTPVVSRAKTIVQKAEACGFDVEKLREKYKDQEPE